MSLVEEDVILGLVADKRVEVFADYAVPVGAVLLVELLLDVFGHQVLCLEVVDCELSLISVQSTSFIA